MSNLLAQTIPSAISGTRIVIGLAFPWIPPEWRLPAAVLAAFTDLIDGPLSRWFKTESVFGQMLDPIADKIFLAAVIITALAEGSLVWWEVVLLGTRDLTVLTGCAVVLLIQGWSAWTRMQARLLGKLTTVLQIACVLVLLWGEGSLLRILLIPTAIVGLLAFVDYFVAFRGRRSD